MGFDRRSFLQILGAVGIGGALPAGKAALPDHSTITQTTTESASDVNGSVMLTCQGLGIDVPIISLSGTPRDRIDSSFIDDSSFKGVASEILRSGEITFDVLYNETSPFVTAIHRALTAKPSTWSIFFPDGSNWSCRGKIISLGCAIPFDDKITQAISIRFTGTSLYTDYA